MSAPLITRDFGLVTVAHFLQGLGYSSMVLLPVYLAHLGASRAEIGWVMATAAIAGLISRPAVAWALDRLGRKPTLAVGTVLLAAGLATFSLVRDLGPWVWVARVLVGTGTGTLFTGYFALASELVPEARRTQGIALFGISGLVPLLVNPLADRLGVAASELRLFFPVVGGLVLLSVLPLAAVRAPPVVRHTAPVPLGDVLSALRQPVLQKTWVGVVALAALASTFMAFATVTARARGVENPTTLWLTYAGGAVVVRLLFSGVAQQVSPHRLIPLAFWSFTLAALAAAVAEQQPLFLVAGLFAGIGHGVGFPLLTSAAVTDTPAHLRGAGMAALTAFWDLSSLVLTPLFGLVSDALSDAAMFAALAVLAALTAVVSRPAAPR
ncbi:MAG: MFS transporter [Myxococcales bacterium]|nr:MFS transporter [Myxococcales bacterium]MCB9646213.1 MFS transporter [Deltaproteobacteria bacterium]